MFRRDHNRFTIMQPAQIMTRGRCQNCGRINLPAIRVTQRFPNPRKGKKRLIPSGNRKGLFVTFFCPLPFVKPIGRDQTAPTFIGRLEAWFFQNGFCARIYQRFALNFSGPARDEAPTGERVFALTPFILSDQGNWLGRRNVVSRREVVTNVTPKRGR